MSYILYSSIARAGGIDLLMGVESFSHPPTHPYRRRRPADRLARLRRRFGQGLLRLGGLLTRWGKRWAPPLAGASCGRRLTLITE